MDQDLFLVKSILDTVYFFSRKKNNWGTKLLIICGFDINFSDLNDFGNEKHHQESSYGAVRVIKLYFVELLGPFTH